MDDIDRAQFRDAQYQDDCERERRYQAAKLPQATGFCLYCKAPLSAGFKFCDAECRDGFDHEQRMKAINGKGV